MICHTFEHGVDLINVPTNELANEKIMATCIDCSDSVSSSSDEEMQVVVQPNVIEEPMKRRHKILIEENCNNVDKEGEGRAMW